MIINKISHSAFSVIQNFTFSSPPFRFSPLNKSVSGVVNESLPCKYSNMDFSDKVMDNYFVVL